MSHDVEKAREPHMMSAKSADPPVLELLKVTKQFGGLKAVNDLDLQVQTGEILGLIGPNGAGKTTVIELISGLQPLTQGQIKFRGQPIDGRRAHERRRMGLARTFQVVKPFRSLTVHQNVTVPALYVVGSHDKRRRMAAAMGKADEVLQTTGLKDKRNALATELTLPDLKRLELARALASEPQVLLLDEVMAGLNPKEIDGVLSLIRTINVGGVTMIVIEHVMRAIMAVSDRVAVLQHGSKISEGTPQEVVADPAVVSAYLGARFSQARSGPEDRRA